ncbi:ATP-binding protein [Caldisalinibacter kiritimatiensis]|uniref:DNA double-strand break repair Rad50 ATPase n=1 Tax=Caldisalinibacter kiritimatiensis TaxID=1304284 RepID=R1CE88_9FIRM|nr:hypothetical protein [Caldisalinibacter kiritimatiensis]EOD00605.1 hypothetical protein L21TH_1366 [Caldisalinibacter kiritimatiensis]
MRNLCEELNSIYKEKNKEYEKLLSRANSLMRIKEEFDSVLEEMDQNSFEPLVDSFSKYLTKLTLDNYSIGDISEEFNLIVKTSDSKTMPIDLLSAGTYDCVALALRLAILENLFEDENGFIILDDCLVDLDPERKQRAIETIKEFGKDRQVIFTTCNPDTAQALGGNIICL